VHEQITLLNNGNDVMGAVGSTLTATANPALAVAQQLINTFALPTTAGTQAQWPVFPNNAPAVATPALSITLPAALTITAAWFNTAATDYTKVDVVVTISGFPTARRWTGARGAGHGDDFDPFDGPAGAEEHS
jgi:hypothetical protein